MLFVRSVFLIGVMKKIVFILGAFVMVTFGCTGNKTAENTGAVDSDTVVVDTAAIDSTICPD